MRDFHYLVRYETMISYSSVPLVDVVKRHLKFRNIFIPPSRTVRFVHIEILHMLNGLPHPPASFLWPAGR